MVNWKVDRIENEEILWIFSFNYYWFEALEIECDEIDKIILNQNFSHFYAFTLTVARIFANIC